MKRGKKDKAAEEKTMATMKDVLEEDARFAAVAYDPRFQRFPKAKAKVTVDDRFKGGRAFCVVLLVLLVAVCAGECIMYCVISGCVQRCLKTQRFELDRRKIKGVERCVARLPEKQTK